MSAEQSKRVARVLSISGDGVRTAVAAHVLAELEHRTGQPVHKLFHLIVGEGAGAVLAMLICRWGPKLRLLQSKRACQPFARRGPGGHRCGTVFGVSRWTSARRTTCR